MYNYNNSDVKEDNSIKVGLKSKVEPTLVFFNYWNFNVGPMLDIRQYANNDVLSTTPTIIQRCPNDCLLSVPFSQNFYLWTFYIEYKIQP